MFKTITNLASYATAPKPTFYMKHPVRAMRVRRFRNNVKDMVTSQRFLLGLGAAAVAIPLSLWAGRRTTESRPQDF